MLPLLSNVRSDQVLEIMKMLVNSVNKHNPQQSKLEFQYLK